MLKTLVLDTFVGENTIKLMVFALFDIFGRKRNKTNATQICNVDMQYRYAVKNLHTRTLTLEPYEK